MCGTYWSEWMFVCLWGGYIHSFGELFENCLTVWNNWNQPVWDWRERDMARHIERNTKRGREREEKNYWRLNGLGFLLIWLIISVSVSSAFLFILFCFLPFLPFGTFCVRRFGCPMCVCVCFQHSLDCVLLWLIAFYYFFYIFSFLFLLFHHDILRKLSVFFALSVKMNDVFYAFRSFCVKILKNIPN